MRCMAGHLSCRWVRDSFRIHGRSARGLRGFTLVELLVVMTIIGILMSLLLPAVQASREAARQTACLANLNQIGLAALSHEHQYGWFPTGGWGKGWAGDSTLGYSANQPGGFFYNLLPFIDQATLWAYGQTMDQTTSPATKTTQLQAASMPVAVYNCVSRRPLGVLPAGSGVSFINLPGFGGATQLAKCDYAACGGDADKGAGPPTFAPPTTVAAGKSATFWSSAFTPAALTAFNGICAPHSQVQGGSITRGRSALFLVGEKYLDPDSYLSGQDLGDNATWDYGFDPNVIRWSGGGSTTTTDTQYLPLQDTPGTANSVAFGSAHVAGFGMVFCDGSSRALNYTIDPTMYGYLGDRTLTTDKADLMDDAKW